MTLRTIAVKSMRAIGVNRILSKLYYRHVHGFASAGKELPDVVDRCLRKAQENNVTDGGDYCEFGVFKGHTFLHAQLAARRLGLNDMRFFGFDSFEGLPPVSGVDDTEIGEFYEGQYFCSLEQVKQSLDEHGFDWQRAELIKGFFCDTLNDETKKRLNIKKVAVALIDGDLYSSADETLRFLEPLLQNGTILIMDDWNCFDRDDNKGERLALREFLDRHPRWRVEPMFEYGSYGQVFELLTRN